MIEYYKKNSIKKPQIIFYKLKIHENNIVYKNNSINLDLFQRIMLMF